MSEELDNSLWNAIVERFGEAGRACWNDTARVVAQHFRKVPIDELPPYEGPCLRWLKDYYWSLDWAETYDLVEFLVHNVDIIKDPAGHRRRFGASETDQFMSAVNRVLERELSGYRFVSRVLSPISDPSEILAIESAAESAGRNGLAGAREHIRAALELLGKKPTPDYRNSIKESISAVESAVRLITGSTSSGVSDAIERLAKSAEIHGALKAAFKQLYGFTSDENGIRHAILEQPSVGFDEAKFMLVACSAFVNFLIAKADQAKLLPR
jgi:hypothetical protein